VAPERARKILILADQTLTVTGSMPSPTETDARTIMAAMTLSHIARGTAVTAEIIDPNMDQYLKMAHVTEVIYSREYARLLLGNASSGTGISNIIFDLLDPQTPARIRTLPIPEQFFGHTFDEVRRHIEGANVGSVVIGILENTGNSYRIKEQALRKAQKTPDIQKLVDNLKSVKGIKYNHPIFNPQPGMQIQEGSMAIVVATEGIMAGEKHGPTEVAA
jgi:Trk K+ transport system NAD-binding subunit